MHFRVWAPRARRVEVVLDMKPDAPFALTAEADGYFSGLLADVGAGTRYSFRLDGDGTVLQIGRAHV